MSGGAGVSVPVRVQVVRRSGDSNCSVWFIHLMLLVESIVALWCNMISPAAYLAELSVMVITPAQDEVGVERRLSFAPTISSSSSSATSAAVAVVAYSRIG